MKQKSTDLILVVTVKDEKLSDTIQFSTSKMLNQAP